MLSTVHSPVDGDSLDNSTVPEALEKKKKKKKKRARDEDQPDDTVKSAGQPNKRQKRKENSDHQGLISPSVVEEAPEIVSAAAVIPAENETSLRKNKRKKKDKGKEKATPLVEQTDAEIEANSQASAAALLSAIVATMSNPPPQLQPPMSFNHHLPPPTGQPFIPFPFGFPLPSLVQTSAAHPNAFVQPPSAPGSNVTQSNNVPLSELAFGSNEDVLRALQELDMSKLANTLKSLTEASSANGPSIAPLPGISPQLSFMSSDSSAHLPPGGRQVAVQPTLPTKISVSSHGQKRTIDMSLPGNEQHTNPAHAHILATKWMNASKLAELVREQGLVYRKGKFSAIEEKQLKIAIAHYQQASQEKQLANDDLIDLIFSKNDKAKNTAFWSEITAAVPLRPIIAVYHHVRRIYHPCSKRGAWQSEEDEALIAAVSEFGQSWEKVSSRVGRMSSDCRDRYRNHIVNRDIRVTGPWSKEEEEKLTQIVTDMTIKQGKNIDNDVFWGKVSELMGGTRGRQQCRIKWTDALCKTVKNEGQKPRWSQQDAYILVHKIDSLNVRDDTEIDWKVISDPDWNLWSAHTLQRRWLTLKKSVKGYEDMTHQEIMDILRIKKAHLPTPSTPSVKKRKERKVTSAAAVNEPDSRESKEMTPDAGSSTRADTRHERQDDEHDSGEYISS